MIAYLAGIGTVFVVAYLCCGIYFVYQAVRHERPSQIRHNAPPDKWFYHDSAFAIAMLISPLLWPLVILVFRLNSRWAVRRWNRMSIDERKAEIAAHRARKS